MVISSKRFVARLARAASLSVVIASSNAVAHGGLPRAFEILVEPGNPSDVVLRSDLWGFFRTRDAGSTWTWTCAEAYGSSSLSVNHRHLALAPGGRLIAESGFRGIHSTDDGCVWNEAAEFRGALVVDVQVSGSSIFALTSTNTGTDAGVSSVLWQSENGGDGYAPVSASLPGDFAASALAIAPSDARRIYVIGRRLISGDALLQRSDDGGATWREFPVPVSDAFPTLRIAGVHPTRPDVVFVWVDLPEDYMQNAPDTLFETTDGGSTWNDVYDASGDLPGFAFSPEGTRLLVGGPVDGLNVANLDGVPSAGRAAFAPFSGTSRAVWGLHWDDGGLTAGTDNFAKAGAAAFTYGLFRETTSDFAPLMNVCDAQFPACDAGSTVAVACTPVFDDPAGGFRQDYLQSKRCLARADAGARSPLDAGAAPDASSPRETDGGAPVDNPGDARNDAAAPHESARKRAAAPVTVDAHGGCALASLSPTGIRLWPAFTGLLLLLRRRKRAPDLHTATREPHG